jgi:hypothetical protein
MQPFLDDLDAVISYTMQLGTLTMALEGGGGLMVFLPVDSAPPAATPAAG